ncbi:MAG: hypothetical protein M1812_006015 [Candelaria pacifica]|nr:MAG: hypothetical protein M1812_006015 [Candelaria pacifica]
MGSHICSSAPPRSGLAIPAPRYNGHTRLNDHASTFSGHLRPSRVPPPRIDLSAANRPFLGHDQLTPALSPISRSASPGTPHSARSARFAMPGRSATSPLPRHKGPPSPELTNLDCAFPPFPNTRARSTTPTESKRSRSSKAEAIAISEKRPSYSALGTPTLKPIAGDSLLQRMNSIVPGPFGVGEQKASLLNPTTDGAAKQAPKGALKGENGMDTSKALDNKEFNHSLTLGPPPPRPPRSHEPLDLGVQLKPHEQPSAIEPWRSQAPAGIITPRHDVSTSATVSMAAPSPNVAPPRPPRPENLFDFGGQIAVVTNPPSQQPLRSENRSQTFPLIDESRGKGKGPSGPLPRRPSEPNPAPRARRPTIITALRPPYTSALSESQAVTQSPLEIRSSPLASEGITSSQLPAHAGGNTPSKDARIDQTPFSAATDRHVGLQYHTPTESSSSNGSGYGSEAKTGSSRSSPPTSEVSTGNGKKLSNATDIDNLMDDIETSIQRMSPKKSAPSPTQTRSKTPSFSRPLFTRPLAPPRLDPALEAPESPMDPAIQDGLIITRASLTRAPPPSPPVPAVSPVQPPKRGPTTSRKGNCRGCGEVIVGKSVSSADGRLTGRYHKPCFVCMTCKEPFQTADFYVIKNQPYCERHYHQLNNTVCQTCNRGIEGQYLETEKKQKFHPRCFSCQDCRKVLGHDYFELNGKVFCEQHAFRAAQQTHFLGPGRKHPERRTTKLMFMEGVL